MEVKKKASEKLTTEEHKLLRDAGYSEKGWLSKKSKSCSGSQHCKKA
jgi:hypothetical protein